MSEEGDKFARETLAKHVSHAQDRIKTAKRNITMLSDDLRTQEHNLATALAERTHLIDAIHKLGGSYHDGRFRQDEANQTDPQTDPNSGAS